MFVFILKQEIVYYYKLYGSWWLVVWHIYQFQYIFKITVKWLFSFSLYVVDFCTKTDAVDKIKYYRLFKNTTLQQL